MLRLQRVREYLRAIIHHTQDSDSLTGPGFLTPSAFEITIGGVVIIVVIFLLNFLLYFFHYHLIPSYPFPSSPTVVCVHEPFSLFAQSFYPHPPSSLAVILLSIYEPVSIFLISSFH